MIWRLIHGTHFPLSDTNTILKASNVQNAYGIEGGMITFITEIISDRLERVRYDFRSVLWSYSFLSLIFDLWSLAGLKKRLLINYFQMMYNLENIQDTVWSSPFN